MKSFQTFLKEARKNPDLNPKIPIKHHLWEYSVRAKNIPRTGILNAFVSFTQIDKLGINPQSLYNTPLGIYAYPMHYVMEIGGDSNMSDLPFAGGSDYVNLFSIKGNVIDINNFSESDLLKYLDKIKLVIAKEHRVKSGTKEFEDINNIIDDIEEKSDYLASRSIPGGRFWYIIKESTAYFGKYKNIEWKFLTKKYDKLGDISFATKRYSIFWNKLFREIGIDAAVDMGDGIIHSSEPTQMVVFNPRAIKNKERHYNKYHPDTIKTGQIKKDSFDYYKQASANEVIRELFFFFGKNKTLIKAIKEIPTSYSDTFIDFFNEYYGDFNHKNLRYYVYELKKYHNFFRNFSKTQIKTILSIDSWFSNIFVYTKNLNFTFEVAFDLYNNSATSFKKLNIKYDLSMLTKINKDDISSLLTTKKESISQSILDKPVIYLKKEDFQF
jgi:hypothetical protein